MLKERNGLVSRPVFAALLLCLAARLAYGLLTPQDYGRRPLNLDGWGTIALNLQQGKGFSLDGESLTAIRGPVFPAVLAAWYGAFGVSRASVVVLQSLLDALTALLLAIMACRWGVPRRAVALALAAWAFYFPQWFYITRAMSESFFTFMLVLSVFLLSRSAAPGYAAMALSALSLGLTALVRPVALFYGLAVVGLRWDAAVPRAWLKRFVYASVLAIPLLTWGWRNARVMDRFMVGSSLNGGALYINTYRLDEPGATTHEPLNNQYAASKFKAEMADRGIAAAALTEMEQKDWKQKLAKARIRAYPLRYVRQCVNNGLSMLLGCYDFRFMSPSHFLVALLNGAIFVLAGIGLWKSRGTFFHPHGLLILLIFLLNTGAHVAVYGLVRFNIPMIPLLLLPAALGLTALPGLAPFLADRDTVSESAA